MLQTTQMTNKVWADIHTHILPGIDDGASTAEESVMLLESLYGQGVTDVVLTPHFHLSEEDVQNFLDRRNTSYTVLLDKIKENGVIQNVKLHLGAEVRYDPNLVYTDIYKLCIENTSYLLLELTKNYPFNFEKTIQWMLSQGVTPILAHIERFNYLINDRKLMEKLLREGAVFQCNAAALLNGAQKGTIKRLVKKGYVQLIASDTHSSKFRPPVLAQAYDKLKKYSETLKSNSARVIGDVLLPEVI